MVVKLNSAEKDNYLKQQVTHMLTLEFSVYIERFGVSTLCCCK